jgi:plasmid stability protein
MQSACAASNLAAMPSLQIRDLPEPLHRLLQHRAQVHKRSLSQQALVDLEAIASEDGRERRRLVLDRIARRGPLATALAADQTPEALIRADRER